MSDPRTTTERAFELAQSGDHASVNDIRQRLKREGYEDVRTELRSPAINQQIIALIKRAHSR